PRLIDLVLREAMLGQQARTEVAIDHAHRRVAEHQCQNALLPDFGSNLFRHLQSFGSNNRGKVQFIVAVTDSPGRAPLVKPLHELLVLRPVRRGGPDSTVAAVDGIQTSAGIEESDESWPSA